MEKEYIRALEQIKQKLKKQELSVLVGAGFSKNVNNDIFLNWEQLLSEIVEELYELEIENSYNLYQSVKLENVEKRLSRVEYSEHYIKKILNREGYLEVVSQYIKHKGYREAITTYIEDRTPHIINNKLIVNKPKPETIDLKKEMLSQHEKLLLLDWNNIYTTNYDRLFEECIREKSQKLKNKLKSINEKINDLITNKNDLITKKNELKDKQNKININIENNNTIEIKEVDNITFDNLHNDLKNINNELDNVNNKLKTKQKEKEEIEEENRKLWQDIDNSSGLSLKKNKKIVKLHGTLRTPDNHKLEFDNDISKRYVIAKEDYDTYPEKHEAFTQLMRLSLLQESFVLIGFSGVDPNFTAWIGWMRTILERKNTNGNLSEEKNYKIYLIDFDNRDKDGNIIIDRSKELFYENHQIIRIPIDNWEVIQHFRKSTSTSDPEDDKKLQISLFLDYLNYKKEDLRYFDPRTLVGYWDMYITTKENSYSKHIYQSKDQYRVFPFEYHIRLKIEDFLENIYEKIINEGKTLLKEEYQLIHIAFNQLQNTTHRYWTKEEKERIFNLIPDVEIKSALNKIDIRYSILKCDARYNEVENEFDNILISAFSFDFDKLYEKVNIWEPNDFRILNKTFFLSIFNENDAIEYISTKEIIIDNLLIEDQYRFYLTLKNIKEFNNIEEIEVLTSKIKKIKTTGIINDYKNLKEVFNQLSGFSKNTQPLSTKNNNKNCYLNIYPEYVRIGEYAIQFFIETGNIISFKNTIFYSEENWYQIFQSIFEIYPYPSIFYSLLFFNENLLKTIGQDIICSEKLKDQKVEILQRLFNALIQEKTPIKIKRNIYTLIPELLIAIPPKYWETQFQNKWKDLVENRTIEKGIDDITKNFLFSGFNYLNNPENIQYNLIELLSIKAKDSSFISSAVYNLTLNENFKKNIKEYNINNAITNFISDIDKSNIWKLYVLYIIRDLINNNTKYDLIKKVKTIDFSQYNSNKIWEILIRFFYDDVDFIEILKKEILKNRGLWHNGLHNNGMRGFSNSISIHRIEKSGINKHGIEWSKDELYLIFDKLINSFEAIQHLNIEHNYFNDLRPLTQEMLWFLERYESILKLNKNYKSTRDNIRAFLNKSLGFVNLVDGIISNNGNSSKFALNWFYYKSFYNKMAIDEKETLLTCLYKIKLKNQPNLKYTLNIISDLFWSFKEHEELKEYSQDLIKILEIYKANNQNFYLPHFHLYLVMIACILDYWKIKNSNIDFWLSIGKNSKYNNVCQFYDINRNSIK